jgi:hypothetical protein
VARGRSGVAVGFTYFAAIMMMLTGGLEILQGLSAIIRKNLYVVNKDYIYKINVNGWGWIHLILGVIVLLAGIALLGGALGSDRRHCHGGPDSDCKLLVAAVLPGVGHRPHRAERGRHMGARGSRPGHRRRSIDD